MVGGIGITYKLKIYIHHKYSLLGKWFLAIVNPGGTWYTNPFLPKPAIYFRGYMETLAAFFYNFAVFIPVISIIVFVHEFGHYYIAKRCGVKVEVFSIGFG